MNGKGYAIITIFAGLLLGFCIQLWLLNKEAKELYDGMLVQDRHGNLYVIEHNLGQTFTIKKVPQWDAAIDTAKGGAE